MALIDKIKSLYIHRDCYKGRHKMLVEKRWKTDRFEFVQKKCKRCGLRKVATYPLDD